MYTLIGAKNWPDYALLDSGNGRRLERFGDIVINRPDPQALWTPLLNAEIWNAAHAEFSNDVAKDKWLIHKKLPDKWILKYQNLSFFAKLTPFKHTGVFPEQSVNWDLIMEKCATRTGAKVLNLFAYTGIATLAAASSGAHVTHVDASKPSITWARENLEASGLSDHPVRWIFDDAMKFTAREIRRGVKYDGIIMDPPVYGHGPAGETWDFMRHFSLLLKQCTEILVLHPLFFIVNAYAISASHQMLFNMLQGFEIFQGGKMESGELVLEEQSGQRQLSTGIFARWQS